MPRKTQSKAAGRIRLSVALVGALTGAAVAPHPGQAIAVLWICLPHARQKTMSVDKTAAMPFLPGVVLGRDSALRQIGPGIIFSKGRLGHPLDGGNARQVLFSLAA